MIREPSPDDEAVIDSWVGEAVTAVNGGIAVAGTATTWRTWQGTLTRRQRPLAIVRADRPVGLAVVRSGGIGPVWLDVFVIEAGLRNLGLGTEAVLLLEERFGSRPLIAGVPLTNGLAIYFWLRAGYTPVYAHGRTPGLARDRVWMRRTTCSTV